MKAPENPERRIVDADVVQPPIITPDAAFCSTRTPDDAVYDMQSTVEPTTAATPIPWNPALAILMLLDCLSSLPLAEQSLIRPFREIA